MPVDPVGLAWSCLVVQVRLCGRFKIWNLLPQWESQFWVVPAGLPHLEARGTWEQEHCDVERAPQQHECRGGALGRISPPGTTPHCMRIGRCKPWSSSVKFKLLNSKLLWSGCRRGQRLQNYGLFQIAWFVHTWYLYHPLQNGINKTMAWHITWNPTVSCKTTLRQLNLAMENRLFINALPVFLPSRMVSFYHMT